MDELMDMEEWGKEIEYVDVQNAFEKAMKLCHPEHIGLTEQDRAEIKAYKTGLNHFIRLLKEEIEK